MSGWNVASIVALITAIGTVIGVIANARKQRTDAAAQIASAYDVLCKTLRAEIDTLRLNTVQDRKQIDELREQIYNLQDALKTSEAERVRLQKEVDELSTRLSRYEKQPMRPARTAKCA